MNGSQIVSEQWDDKLVVYLYDESGSPIGMQYRTKNMAEGTFYTYLFEKNLQGDIIAVYNTSGTKLVSYVYDAWGNVTVTNHNVSGTNSGARHNPFRYRGYYYDTETGYYYLQSRYYNPKWGRFLNADSYLNASGEIIGYNMYTYCNNNPIKGYDPTGKWNWDNLIQFGRNLINVAVASVAIVGAGLSIGAAITGTIVSGGAGAITIPAAIAAASQCIVVAASAVATIGAVSIAVGEIGNSVSYMTGENGQQIASKTTWKGNGSTERLDVENPSPGKRAGQIHYHDENNVKYMYDFSVKQFKNPTKRLKSLLTDKNFLKGLEKAFKILGETW